MSHDPKDAAAVTIFVVLSVVVRPLYFDRRLCYNEVWFALFELMYFTNPD